MEIQCPEADLEKIVLPHLQGTVFHLTTLRNYQSILKDALIRHNQNGNLTSPFPFEKHFGSNRGYVCLFDLRNTTPEQIQNALVGSLHFLDPFDDDTDVVYLFVSPRLYGKLITNEKAPALLGDRRKEMWIPEVECWHEGDIPIDLIERVLVVHIVCD